MRPFRLSRRALLRGAGGVAVALPWLEAMTPIKEVRAAGAPAKRFVAVYTPGGTLLEQFTPPRHGTDLSLMPPILAPLLPHQNTLVVLQGLGMSCIGQQARDAGMMAWLTGATRATFGAVSPSLDQALAQQLGGAPLYQSVRWGTGALSEATADTTNVVSYQLSADRLVPVTPDLDPAATWRSLFAGEGPDFSPDWRKSVLDSVLARYQSLSQRLGAADRMRLEQHMDHLRALEMRVEGACQRPREPELGAYNPRAFGALSPQTDEAIPDVGLVMMDLLVVALACDLRRVATLQWADASARYTLPWLQLAGNAVHSYYEGGSTYQPEELQKIFTWYSTRHNYLLEQMAQVDMGGHSLLDESVVFFGSHVQSPEDYAASNMPFLLAGGGGGLVGNRFRNYADRPHNDLLAGIFNLFGDHTETYGDAAFNTEPIEDLTSYA